MTNFKGYSLCKFLAIILSVLIAGQIHFAFSAQEETPQSKFKAAVSDYANGNYGSARTILTGLTRAGEENEQNKLFLGRAYLLLAASEEMLKENEKASSHYLKAKQLLAGQQPIIEGLSFSGLSLYLGVFSTPQAREEAAALNAQFELAKKRFLIEDYEGARMELEKLMSSFAALEGWDILKGETYLLLGASYEKLKYKELAVKYYCEAKDILGIGKTVAGLELKTLRYYREECRAVAAQPGAKKGSFLGKALGFILGAAILGGVIWYLFFSKNAPFKAKGAYTSVTVKMDITFKGFNSKTYHTVDLNGTNYLTEHVIYTQHVSDESKCADPTINPTAYFCPYAEPGQSYSWTIETDGKSLDVVIKYIDWEFYSCCCKVLCEDWNFSVVGYKYESGKRDPGSPIIEGAEQLDLDIDKDCLETSPTVHTCTKTVHLTYKAPSAGQQAQKVYSVHQTTGTAIHN